MKRHSLSAFTLIEMLTVIVLIAVLASMVIGISGFVNAKAARSRAEGEIQAMATACESYKTDNGTYPQNTDTDALNAEVDGAPTSTKYTKASLYLYTSLSGDAEPVDAPDFKPEGKIYYTFRPEGLSAVKANKKITSVKYIQDPFGNCYGYSTAGLKSVQESKAQSASKNDPSEDRPGYNTTFDLWSTGGKVSAAGQVDQAKWIKNW